MSSLDDFPSFLFSLAFAVILYLGVNADRLFNIP